MTVAVLTRPSIAIQNEDLFEIKRRLDELMADTKLGGSDQRHPMLSELQTGTTGPALSEDQTSQKGLPIKSMGSCAWDLRSGTCKPDSSLLVPTCLGSHWLPS